jgi:hypothetical protein
VARAGSPRSTRMPLGGAAWCTSMISWLPQARLRGELRITGTDRFPDCRRSLVPITRFPERQSARRRSLLGCVTMAPFAAASSARPVRSGRHDAPVTHDAHDALSHRALKSRREYRERGAVRESVLYGKVRQLRHASCGRIQGRVVAVRTPRTQPEPSKAAEIRR